ncbi:type II toxin-antitoxin system RelB/DinJ family antitoxin [Candidatus Azambacteria bacterium]|nr:type II toxin-antitoxin system RelB/DinJ family antitoxin [Candidatus Azambacteria bacterium]
MKTSVSIKLDKDIKEQATQFAREIGLPLSTIINANLREIMRSGEVRISLEPKIKPVIWEEMKKAVVDYQVGKNISQALKNKKEVMNYLELL